MNNCEYYLTNASALTDGELEGSELADTVKHLADCPACMAQFEIYQRLQQRLSAETQRPAVPPHIWPTISAHQNTRKGISFIPFKSRGWRVIGLAAAFVLCFGLGYGIQSWHLPQAANNARITLASAPGSLSDDRFLVLTRELLSADPEYQKKMYMILRILNEERREKGMESSLENELPASARIIQTDAAESREVSPGYRF